MKWGIRNLALLTPLALATAAFGQVFTSTPGVAITDAVTVDDSIVVAGGPVSITDLNVVVNITHTFDADLDFVLIPPGGTSYIHLSSDNGSLNDNYLYTRFDDSAAISITAGAAPFRGNFMPEGGVLTPWIGTIALPATALTNLASVNGTDSNGTWTLRIDDDLGGDVGTLLEWRLEFNGATSAIPLALAGFTIPATNRLNGDVITLAVSVSPGEAPASTGIGVTVDLSPLGGSPTQAFLDNGVAPDVLAGDSIFSYSHTISGAAVGTVALNVTATDAEARTATGVMPSFAIATGAQGLPTATVDLGSVVNPTVSTGTLTGFASGSGVQWIKVTIPETSVATSTYLDIDTNGAGAGNTFTNSTMALYDSSGARMGTADLDDGASLFSMLSYGLTAPARPAVPFVAPATANGLTHAGADGATLPAGTYWLGVGGTGTTFDATNWRYTSTSTQAGDCAYRLELGSNTTPTNPTGTGAIGGVSSCPGIARLMTVNVTPGTNPVSSGVGVTANLSAAGGSASQAFFNDGTNGDVTAGDNLWSFSFTPATPGAFAAMPFTITDAQSRSGAGTFGTLTVLTCTSGMPSSFVDLGALTNSPVSDAHSYAAGEVHWYRFSVGVVADPASYLDVWTAAGAAPGTLTDTEVALYDNSGNLMGTDDDDSDANYSALSFGRVTPNRPAIGTGTAFNGRDLGLAAGTYWLAVCEFPTTFFTTNWSLSITTVADAGDVVTNISYFDAASPIPPTGTGTGGVVNGCGGSVLATVAVTPGSNPASTGLAVSLNTAAIGGGSVAMFDNGTNGDVTAGDNTFSLSLSIPGGADATLNFPFSITDAQARSGSGSLNVTRSGTEVGDLPSSAQTYYGISGTTITGTISGGSDVDMFAICVADTANFEASVNNGGAAFDTQLFLFNADGTGAAMNDDEPDVAQTLQSHMMLNNSLLLTAPPVVLASGGLYYLALAPYNRDPISSATVTDLIWNNTATTPAGSFDATWAPNGVTPSAPVVGWTNVGNAGGAFTITMVGGSTVCPADLSNSNLAAAPDCAVDINDLLYFLTAFEAGNADVDNGSGTGALDCATDINDLLFFLIHFEAGC